MSFICRRDIPEVKDLKPNELTVGRHLFLVCEGDFDKTFDLSKAKLILDEKSNLVIKLFSVEARSINSIELNMTFYAAGEIKIPELVLTDGAKSINLGEQSFKVESVLPITKKMLEENEKNQESEQTQKSETSENNQNHQQQQSPQQLAQQQQQPPKPFGYILTGLDWPLEYFLVFIGFLFVLISVLIRQLYLKRKLKKYIKTLQNYENLQTPENEFYKTIRKLEKKHFSNEELYQACMIYISRRFQIPVFYLSNKEIEKYFFQLYPELINLKKSLVNQIKSIQHFYKINQKNNFENLTDAEKQKYIQQAEQHIKHMYEFIEKNEKVMSRRHQEIM